MATTHPEFERTPEKNNKKELEDLKNIEKIWQQNHSFIKRVVLKHFFFFQSFKATRINTKFKIWGGGQLKRKGSFN